MEKESTGERGMGVRYKGRQGQTERTVELQEEEEEEEEEEEGLISEVDRVMWSVSRLGCFTPG
jgi:hypothetical protein